MSDLIRAFGAGPRLVYAMSGMGKSWLCAMYPDRTFDTDVAFDAALSDAFPTCNVAERRRLWRALARACPWESPSSRAFDLWARTRRRFVADILTQLQRTDLRLVLTNLTLLPWPYDAYFAIEIGQYHEHLRLVGRAADNGQSEGANAQLEGYAPLRRLPPGSYLTEQPELIALLG